MREVLLCTSEKGFPTHEVENKSLGCPACPTGPITILEPQHQKIVKSMQLASVMRRILKLKSCERVGRVVSPSYGNDQRGCKQRDAIAPSAAVSC